MPPLPAEDLAPGPAVDTGPDFASGRGAGPESGREAGAGGGPRDGEAPVLLRSARPELTAQMMAQSGLDDEILRRLVHRFYAKIRKDPLLGPIFEARIHDWPAHLERMCAFWSSVALATGRYRGAPMPAHMPLPVDWAHFRHWLALFEQTAAEVCPPRGAAHVTERAGRIARSLHMGVQEYQRAGATPRL